MEHEKGQIDWERRDVKSWRCMMVKNDGCGFSPIFMTRPSARRNEIGGSWVKRSPETVLKEINQFCEISLTIFSRYTWIEATTNVLPLHTHAPRTHREWKFHDFTALSSSPRIRFSLDGWIYFFFFHHLPVHGNFSFPTINTPAQCYFFQHHKICFIIFANDSVEMMLIKKNTQYSTSTSFYYHSRRYEIVYKGGD